MELQNVLHFTKIFMNRYQSFVGWIEFSHHLEVCSGQLSGFVIENSFDGMSELRCRGPDVHCHKWTVATKHRIYKNIHLWRHTINSMYSESRLMSSQYPNDNNNRFFYLAILSKYDIWEVTAINVIRLYGLHCILKNCHISREKAK